MSEQEPVAVEDEALPPLSSEEADSESRDPRQSHFDESMNHIDDPVDPAEPPQSPSSKSLDNDDSKDPAPPSKALPAPEQKPSDNHNTAPEIATEALLSASHTVGIDAVIQNEEKDADDDSNHRRMRRPVL